MPAGGAYSDGSSTSSDPIPRDVFSSSESPNDEIAAADMLSESSNDDIAAAEAFSSSDLNNDNAETADAVSDDSSEGGLGGRILGAILGGRLVVEGESAPSVPSIPGPFTPQYFSTIPSTWLDLASDDEGNNLNNPED